MKKSMLAAVLIFPVVVGATWLGCRWLAPIYEPYRYDYCVMVTCGGGDYSTEIFRTINGELDRKLVEILGYYTASQHLAVVVPDVSGYRVQMFGPPSSKLGESNQDHHLQDWIQVRMDEVELEVRQGASSLDVE